MYDLSMVLVLEKSLLENLFRQMAAHPEPEA